MFVHQSTYRPDGHFCAFVLAKCNAANQCWQVGRQAVERWCVDVHVLIACVQYQPETCCDQYRTIQFYWIHKVDYDIVLKYFYYWYCIQYATTSQGHAQRRSDVSCSLKVAWLLSGLNLTSKQNKLLKTSFFRKNYSYFEKIRH